MEITQANFIRLLRDVAELNEREQDRLSELDRAIGDGDHGVTMANGWKAAVAALDGLSADPGFPAICNTAAKAFMNAAGGSAGPLYATILMRGGNAVKERTRLERDDLLRFFEAACQGIRDRGKTSAGDKTMLDAWIPAVEAMRAACAADRPMPECLRAASEAAETGARATAGMMAKLGRASRLGERSVGHIDPGAASSALFFQAFAAGVSDSGSERLR